jgi:TRAP-type C4-dicarboxylate transport system permease small subunit
VRPMQVIFRAVDFTAKVLLIALTVVVSGQIFVRFVFNAPWRWANELSRLLFTWLGFYGLIIAVKDNAIPSFDAFVHRFSGSAQEVLAIILDSIMILFLVIVSVGSISALRTAHTQTMSILPLRWSYVYASFPVSMLILAGVLIHDMLRLVKKRRHRFGDCSMQDESGGNSI